MEEYLTHRVITGGDSIPETEEHVQGPRRTDGAQHVQRLANNSVRPMSGRMRKAQKRASVLRSGFHLESMGSYED